MSIVETFVDDVSVVASVRTVTVVIDVVFSGTDVKDTVVDSTVVDDAVVGAIVVGAIVVISG